MIKLVQFLRENQRFQYVRIAVFKNAPQMRAKTVDSKSAFNIENTGDILATLSFLTCNPEVRCVEIWRHVGKLIVVRSVMRLGGQDFENLHAIDGDDKELYEAVLRNHEDALIVLKDKLAKV